MRVAPWIVAGIASGILVYLVDSGRLDGPDGRFLGFVPVNPAGFGVDDVAKGLVIVGGSFVLGKLAHTLSSGAVPVGVKV